MTNSNKTNMVLRASGLRSREKPTRSTAEINRRNPALGSFDEEAWAPPAAALAADTSSKRERTSAMRRRPLVWCEEREGEARKGRTNG